MKALDTDFSTLLFHGEPNATLMIKALDWKTIHLPIVVSEEMTRGRFASIRRAETEKKPGQLIHAYLKLQQSLSFLSQFNSLPYTEDAEKLFLEWRKAKIHIGTPDLRIAAIAQAHGAELITRNAGDYQQIPGFKFTTWV